MSGYSVSPQALNDLFEIWKYIAQDSEEAADRVKGEFYKVFSSLAQTPRQDVDPIRIITMVHGRRNVKRVLKQRNL